MPGPSPLMPVASALGGGLSAFFGTSLGLSSAATGFSNFSGGGTFCGGGGTTFGGGGGGSCTVTIFSAFRTGALGPGLGKK